MLLDGIVLVFPGAIIRVLFGISSTGFDDLESPNAMLAGSLEIAVDALYAAVFLSSRAGGTLGMQVMGLRAVTVTGHPVSFGRALGRFFAVMLTVLTLGIGYLMQLYTRRRQTLHDLIAGTVVVRVPAEPRTAVDPLANA
jgi:uncharacterized RDD family membrane protein YckC